MEPMERLDLEPNTDEWLEARLEHDCASEAASMMGASKHRSRPQLMDLKKGWQENPNSTFKEKLFQSGHESEAAARPHVEMEEMVKIPPLVGRRVIDGVELLASFDGFPEDEDWTWEHKDWNETLAENVRNCVLEPHYYWQLEHQCLVSGRPRVLFTCSDGTPDRMVSMMYVSVPDRQETLLEGWKLFDQDLEKHQLAAKTEKVTGETIVNLPSIMYSVDNGLVVSNMDEILPLAASLAEREAAVVPHTDQDFANKERLVKDLKSVRQKVKDGVSEVEAKFVSFSEFKELAIKLDIILRDLQTSTERQVKAEKDRRKTEIKMEAAEDFNLFLASWAEQVGNADLYAVVGVTPDLDGAMRNKRTMDSLKAAADEALAQAKLAVNTAMPQIVGNYAFYSEAVESDTHKILFHDLNNLLNQPSESFQAVVKSRIREFEDRQREEEVEGARDTLREGLDQPPPTGETQEEAVDDLVKNDDFKQGIGFADKLMLWAERWDVSQEALEELIPLIEDFINE